nr:MAG TPA: hypothetical protein [Myoviridae sp. ctNqw6]
MDSLDTHFKDIILRHLYRMPQKQRIQKDIMSRLDTVLLPVQIISYRKQLVMEGLITESNPNEEDSPIEATLEGYKVIQLYGNYMDYVKAKKKEVSLSRESQKMQQKYLKLKFVCTIITIILSILSFITGILLSYRIQNILG